LVSCELNHWTLKQGFHLKSVAAEIRCLLFTLPPPTFYVSRIKKCVIYSQSRYRDNDRGFFPWPIAYYRHDYWPLNCKQYKPKMQKSRRFSLPSESLVPVYGMNKFYRPIKNQSTLTLFNQAPPVGKPCINSVPPTM
jgi:hypothetical protein